MLKKSLALWICFIIVIGSFAPSALASSAEYKEISTQAQAYSQNVAKPFYENGTYTPDFWSAFAARKAYLLTDKDYKYLLPQKPAAVADDITAPQLAEIILEIYISGKNPADVNGQNLPQRLANMGKVDGTFGENLTAIEHAKIIMALEWTRVAYFKEAALDHLVTYRGEGGLLLNAEGKESVVSTAWGLMASSLTGYTDALTEQLSVSLKTSISAEGYFCSEVETPSCTTQAMAMIALCFANVNLASESYVAVLDAFNQFQIKGGGYSDTLINKKADNAVTNKAWVAVGLIKEMYGKLETLKAQEQANSSDEQDPLSQNNAQTSSENEDSPLAQNNTANRKFPTGVAVAGGVCLLLVILLLFWRKK